MTSGDTSPDGRRNLLGALTRRPALWVGGAAAGLTVAMIVTIAWAAGGDSDEVAEPVTSPPASEHPLPSGLPTGPLETGALAPSRSPFTGGVECPTATVIVRSASSLTSALEQARPGDSIRLEDGVYQDRFVASVPGTADKPIFLCGGPGAILDGGGVKSGYALHLDGASYWRISGFTVRNGQKGVMADKVQHAVIQGLTVEQIGDEAVHLRNFSSDNIVQGNTIRDTGLRRDKFGEGIYIGTAESNWCTVTDCKPDLSDRNIIRGNNISATTAESVDIKEGTSDGVLSGNTFDGSAFSGSFADSWVDVKGNRWLIEGNTGRNSREDGFQTHEVVDGWGTDNTFTANTAEVNGPGWGFHFAPVRDNKVSCDNTVTGAAKGFANIKCG